MRSQRRMADKSHGVIPVTSLASRFDSAGSKSVSWWKYFFVACEGGQRTLTPFQFLEGFQESFPPMVVVITLLATPPHPHYS